MNNWSVIVPAGAGVGQVQNPWALALDIAGNLYVADGWVSSNRIQKRDTQGNWSVLATAGDAPGQVDYGSFELAFPASLAVDTAANLYVTDWLNAYAYGRIQKRDAQGNWSVIVPAYDRRGPVFVLGPVFFPTGLAVDPAGNLYVADGGNNRVLNYTPGP